MIVKGQPKLISREKTRKCCSKGDSNHGAYIGKFRDEEMFYLMSRGISREDSYRLLLNGFLINSDSIDMNKIDLFVKELENI